MTPAVASILHGSMASAVMQLPKAERGPGFTEMERVGRAANATDPACWGFLASTLLLRASGDGGWHTDDSLTDVQRREKAKEALALVEARTAVGDPLARQLKAECAWMIDEMRSGDWPGGMN